MSRLHRSAVSAARPGFITMRAPKALIALAFFLGAGSTVPAWSQTDQGACVAALGEGVGCAPRLAVSEADREPRGPNQEPAAPRIDSADGFHISIDGGPLATGLPAPADAVRSADVALSGAGQLTQIDPLKVEPVLNVRADQDVASFGQRVVFDTWANYPAFIARAELRMFEAGDSTGRTPLAIVPVEINDTAAWTAPAKLSPVVRSPAVQYVLRVYDAQGRYDETHPQLLALVDGPVPGAEPVRDLMATNALASRSIPVSGSLVTVQTRNGRPPVVSASVGRVGPNGVGLVQVIVPTDAVAVAVSQAGSATSKPTVRTLTPETNPGFLFAFADLTLGQRQVSPGARELLGPDTSGDDEGIADGRLAFYATRQLAQNWRLTASADTREGELDQLFDNMLQKDSRSLLRRLDPDRSWPVFGDDSTLVEDAPTSGRLYVRLDRGEDHLLFGDFQTSLSGNSFADYSRALYGAQLRARSEIRAEGGEARRTLDLFLADPGTIGAREEFLGSGGSVYFLRRQDVLEGSERVFVEIRDRDSGLVVSRRELVPALDYDVNYLQGRLQLTAPLNTTDGSGLFVRDDTLIGDSQVLVVTYEYTPGLVSPDVVAGGGRASTWIGQHLRLGVSGYEQGGDDVDQTLLAGDVTMQIAGSSYLKYELGRSEGAGITPLTSSTGGFEFNALTPALANKADAQRVEAGFDLRDFAPAADGRITGYWQNRDAGFAAPGQITGQDGVQQFGMSADIAVPGLGRFRAKGDLREGEGTDRAAFEAGVERALGARWTAGAGLRFDEQRRVTPSASDLLNASGERFDLALTLGYKAAGVEGTEPEDVHGPWSAYGFVQTSLEATGTRQTNDRLGVGGSWQANQRLRLEGEVSTGDLDLGAKLGAQLSLSERSSAYLNYALGAENADAFETGRLGRMGRLAAGATTRFAGGASVYAENRYVHGAGPTGLNQTYGLTLAPEGAWSFALSTEFGTLSDETAGDLDRRAVSGTLGWAKDRSRWSATLERREDNGRPDATRTLWAWRTLASHQLTDGLRLFAKLNGAVTDDAETAALEAEFLEGTAAFAYRPVHHDRLNLLARITYLEDLPSPAQVTARGDAADFAQRSLVLAIDGTFEVTGGVRVGGRLAQRTSELRLSRDQVAPWFDNEAQFAGVRLDWTVTKGWDGLVEYRTLQMEQIGSGRDGFMAGLWRHVGDGMRVGAGYNFTNFSEDLTDLDGDSEGWFLNFSAAF